MVLLFHECIGVEGWCAWLSGLDSSHLLVQVSICRLSSWTSLVLLGDIREAQHCDTCFMAVPLMGNKNCQYEGDITLKVQ